MSLTQTSSALLSQSSLQAFQRLLMETFDNRQPELAASKPDYADRLLILDKNSQLRTYTPNAAQADFLSQRTGRDLVLKARQMGFSMAIQADHFVCAITRTTMAVTLAHDLSTTQKLRRMAKRFYDHLPDAPPRGLDNATTTTYPQTGSEVT